MPEKKTISARKVVADIKLGMTDEQMTMKYGLSARGLESLKNQLLTAGLLAPEDLERHPPPAQVTVASIDDKEVTSDLAEAVGSSEGGDAQELLSSPSESMPWDVPPLRGIGRAFAYLGVILLFLAILFEGLGA